MKILNTSRINFEYQSEEDQPIIKETKYSNLVTTWIIDQRIKVNKKTDKSSASVYELITYTIEVENMSSSIIKQVIIKDKLPPKLKFVFNSVYINGVKQRCVDPNQGLVIKELNVAQVIVITFKAVVLPKTISMEIKNHGQIDYEYLYHMDLPPIIVTVQTNEVITIIKDKLFKQWTHQTNLKCPTNYSKVNKLWLQDIKISPQSTKLIKNAYGYQLLIIGEVIYDIGYLLLKENRPMGWLEKEGFSCLIKVPEGIQYCKVETIYIGVETVDMQWISENIINISVQVITDLY